MTNRYQKLPVTSLQDFKQRYLQDVNKLYFNCGVRLQDPGTYTAAENIKGYIDIDGIENITFSADKKTAIIPLSLASSGSWGRAINPICKIALQTLRLELPFLAYPNYETTGSSFKQFLGKLFGVFPDMVRLIKGFDKYALDKSWVQAIELSNSWVRLANPNYKKLGGGSRVKEIRMSNYWSSNAASPNAAEYGQRYTYTTENPTDRTQQISSGVAAYEPIIGNEENLFREPVTYEDKIKMAPNNEYYMEKPFGESLFPAPTVGYGSVKVQNLVKVGNNLVTEAEAGLKRTGMGYTVSEFYTAKDFPTVVDFTTKQHVDYQPNTGATFLDFFKIIKKHHTGVSQGYTIEVNDMHGKPKAEYIKNAYGADISWTKYDYRTETDGSKKLKNDGLDLINTEGSLSKGSIGYDFDIWNDMQQDKTITNAPGMSVNSESFFIGFIPIFLVPFFPSICRDESVFRSAVTTKFIKRFGILEKVTKMENGASVSTENLAFDAETGQSLLTRTQNEFKDNVYQFSYPAHWAYENGMGMAYKNIGLYAKDVVIEENGVIPSAFSDYFVSGDELQVTPDRGGAALLNRFHVIQYAETDLSKHIIDPFGAYLPAGAYSLKVLRSGRRNQATASIGSVVSRKDPRQGGKLVFDGQILAAQAVTFKDEWAIRSGRASTCVVNARDIDVNDNVFQLLITALGNRDAKSGLGRTIGAIIGNDREQFLDFGRAGGISYQELSTPSDDGTFTRYEALINGTCLLVIEPDDDAHKGSSFSFNSPIFQDGFLQCLSLEYKYINMRITLTCKDCKEQCYALLKEGNLINPYQLGIKGNWRPEASHALYSQRTGPLSITTKNLRTDGDVVDYENFWVLSPADETTPRTFKPASNLTKWVKANTMTQYDEKGNDVENVDALNIYSSTLFRYKNTLAAAVAANARLREIAFDGFEDYGYNYNYVEGTKDAPTADCGTNHFDFAVVDGTVKTASISRKKAHTGNYSFVLPPKSGGCKKTIPVIAPNGLNDDPNAVVLQTADKRLVNRLLQPFSLTQNRNFSFQCMGIKRRRLYIGGFG